MRKKKSTLYRHGGLSFPENTGNDDISQGVISSRTVPPLATAKTEIFLRGLLNRGEENTSWQGLLGPEKKIRSNAFLCILAFFRIIAA